MSINKEKLKYNFLVAKLPIKEIFRRHRITSRIFYRLKGKLNLPNRQNGRDYSRPTKFPNEHLPLNLLPVIYGCLMGHGYLIPPVKNYYMVIGHSVKQLQWLKWKHKQFGKWAYKIRPINHPDGLQYRFQTPAHPDFTELRKIHYTNPVGKRNSLAKSVSYLIPKLTLQSLAIWYGDDGCLGGKSDYRTRVWLATEGFSLQDISLIDNWFKNNFSLIPRHQELSSGKRIYFSVPDSQKFLELVKPYLPKCMYYKLGFSKNE